MDRRLFLSAAAAAAMAPAWASAEPAAAGPEISAYTKAPALAFMMLSYDGRKLAYVESQGETRRLVVRRLDALTVGEVLGIVDLGLQNVIDVRWADDTHVLITASRFRRNAGERYAGYDIAAAHAYNIETRKMVRLLYRRPGLNYVSGPPFVDLVAGTRKTFVNASGGAWEVDLETGDGAFRDQYYGLTDASGRAAVRSEILWNATDNTYTWRLTARTGMNWHELWALSGNRIEAPQLLGYGRTPGTALVRSTLNGQDTLHEIDVATGARKRLSFPDASGAVAPLYDGDSQRLLGFAFTGENDHTTFFLDEHLQALWDGVNAGLAGSQVTLVSRTPDFSRLIVYTEGPADSGSYWLIDSASGKAVPLGLVRPEVPSARVCEQRFIKYKAADGFEVCAYLTLPVGRPAKGLPLVVLPHGGPQSRDDPGFDTWAQMIASRGYAVLQPQFRGSDGFGPAYYHAGYGEWGGKMLTDLSDGVRVVTAQGVADPSRVAIFGWSYGGYAALQAPIKEPGVYRCAAAGAGLTDLRRMLDWERGPDGFKFGREDPGLRYEERYMGVTSIDDPALDAISPARNAERMTIPLLLVHGQNDMTVPYEQTLILTRALDRANRPYELLAVAGEGHDLQSPANRLAAFTAVVAFLEKHNPPWP
jgi:dipeptidyl aminopeptidase/acylaminoacyl peptidase